MSVATKRPTTGTITDEALRRAKALPDVARRAEVSQALGIPINRLYNWAREGKGPARRARSVNGAPMYRRDDVVAWARRHMGEDLLTVRPPIVDVPTVELQYRQPSWMENLDWEDLKVMHRIQQSSALRTTNETTTSTRKSTTHGRKEHQTS